MDDETICNGGGHIPSAISMTRGMMDVEDVNSEVAAKYIEEEEKLKKQHLAEQKQQLEEQQQQQKLVEKQAQWLAAMSGLTTLHALDGEHDVGLTNTRAAKYQCTSLVGGKCTAKGNKVEKK